MSGTWDANPSKIPMRCLLSVSTRLLPGRSPDRGFCRVVQKLGRGDLPATMAAILIAQAQTDERARLLMALQMAGHDAAEAPDGTTAVAMLHEKPFDVAVIDDELPDMFGSELVLSLRGVREQGTLPAVLLLPACAADASKADSETP